MRYIVGLSFYILLSVVLACSEKPAKDSAAPAPTASVDIHIAIDPEVRTYVKRATDLFLTTDIRLPDGTRIVPKYLEIPGSLAQDQIASGKTKVDGWITQRTLVELTNATIRNLGAPQVDCVPLLATPMVFATTRTTVSGLSLDSTKLDIASLLKLENSNKTLGKTSFLFPDPLKTTSGLHALLQLTYTTGTSEDLYDFVFTATSGYNSSSATLLNKISSEESPHRRFVVTSERSVARFNATAGTRKISALYPAQASVWQDYQLCRSNVEWVNTQKQAALKLLAEYFATNTQVIALEEGFRPARALTASPANSLLTEANGITPELQITPVAPATAKVLQSTLKKWEMQQRPLSIIFVLDSSGSLEDTGIGSVVSSVQRIVARLSLNDMMSIVTVSTDSDVLLEPTSDRTAFINALAKIESIGGTALYDGLLKGVQLGTRLSPPEYRSVIFVISDGPDKNSKTSSDLVRQTVRQAIMSRDIPLYFITITDPGSDFSSLHAMAAEIFATIHPTTFEELPETLEKIWNEL